MDELEIIVKTCADSTSVAKLNFKDRRHIIVYIPNSNHKSSFRIEEQLNGWKIELRHERSGYGKPYLLNLINEEKVLFSIFTHLYFTLIVWRAFVPIIRVLHDPYSPEQSTISVYFGHADTLGAEIFTGINFPKSLLLKIARFLWFFYYFMSFEKTITFCILKNIHDFAWKNFRVLMI